jgi:hypothetical protein
MAGGSLFLHDRQAVLQQRGHRYRLKIKRHLARFHLGQVEDVVDQREQVLTAAEDVANVAALLQREFTEQAVAQHLREPDDGHQWRAQLVRHVGEKLGFHAARVFQFDVLLHHGPLKALELGDVTRRGDHALQIAIAVEKRAGVVRHHCERTVPGTCGELVVGDPAFV